jgi:hypothetical protein
VGQLPYYIVRDGWECTYIRGEERGIQDSCVKERENLEDVCENGSVILIWTIKTGWQGVHWIHVAQGRNEWRDFVHMVMKLLAI